MALPVSYFFMPGDKGPLALLTVPQAFGMDLLHAVMRTHWNAVPRVPVTTDQWSQQMAAAGGLGIAPSQSIEGTDQDPATWLGDMAARGLPGTENSPRYQPAPYVGPARGTPEHEVAFAQDLTSALNQNITRLSQLRSADIAPNYNSNTDNASGPDDDR